MKIWRLKSGTDAYGDSGGVWGLPHDRTPYNDDVDDIHLTNRPHLHTLEKIIKF